MNIRIIEKIVNTLARPCNISKLQALIMKVPAFRDLSSLGILICAILMTHEATGLQRFNHRGIASQRGITKEAIHEAQSLINVQTPLNLNKPVRVSSASFYNHEPDKIIPGNSPQGASVKHVSRDTRSKFVKRRLLACCFGSVRGGRSERQSSQGAATADRGISMDRQASTSSNVGAAGGYLSRTGRESTTKTAELQVSARTKGEHSGTNFELGKTSGSEDASDLKRSNSFSFPRQPPEESEGTKFVSGTLTEWKARNASV